MRGRREGKLCPPLMPAELPAREEIISGQDFQFHNSHNIYLSIHLSVDYPSLLIYLFGLY